MLAHISGLTFLAIPFGNIIGPVLIWQIKREALGEFVAANAREALNFQFTFVLLVGFCFSLYFLPVPGIGALAIMLFVLLVLSNVFLCVAAVIRTNEGELYRYPYTLRPF